MSLNNVRAVAMAFLLCTATAGVALVLASASAEAAAVRPAVGNALKEAIALASAGKYEAAMAKVHEAEGVSDKTSAEQGMISQVKEYVAVRSGNFSAAGGVSSAIAAKAKFAADYSARRYNDVIADAELLRKYGVLDGTAMQVIAQAYYQSGNKSGCVRYIRDNFGAGAGEDILLLQMKCAYDIGDDVAERQALEALVARTGKAEYWRNLLIKAEQARGLNDPQTLDLYRLKFMTGSTTSPDDYMLLAELALGMGSPGEAQKIMEKGIQQKILQGERAQRLLAMAQNQTAQSQATLDKVAAAANAAPTGDPLMKLGILYYGLGRYPNSANALQAALKKGVTDKDMAEVRLGMAYLAADDKDSATRAFAAVHDNPRWQMIAHLWTLYAHSH